MYALFAFVGLGSTLFHMTLRYWGQLFDVLPMMLGSLALTYSIFMCDSKPNVSYWKTDAFFIIWGLVTCFVYLVLKIHFFFFWSYGGQVILSAVIGYQKCKKWGDPLSSYLLKGAIMVYSPGWILWFVDQHYCHVTQPFHLHSIWHVCAGYGSYLGIYSAVCLRAHFLERQCQLKMTKLCRTIPLSHYVIYVDGKETPLKKDE